MIMTLSERPKLHICRGWKHPLLLNSLLSSHMAHVGSGQWKNISSPCLFVGVFVAFHSLSAGLLGVYILLKTVSGCKNFVLQTLGNISRGLQPQLSVISLLKHHPLGGSWLILVSGWPKPLLLAKQKK